MNMGRSQVFSSELLQLLELLVGTRLTRILLRVTRVTYSSYYQENLHEVSIFSVSDEIRSRWLLCHPPAFARCDRFAAESGLDTAKIESVTGLKGVPNEKENTFKVSKPRTDVAITVDQARLAAFMGFTSWATFTPGTKDNVMVMGDMVLFEDEVNPVMSVALDKGLEVTALHNHFFFDDPKVYFMHIGGEGAVDSWPRRSGDL